LSTGKRTVLVVEDDEDTAELFSEMLKVNDFEVTLCSRSNQAIKEILDDPPDAIVLDIMMPEASGLEVLHFIRTKSEMSHIPVVVVSAKGLPSDISEGLAAGANQYLIKPVSYDDLCRAIQTVLD
jgi:DNA-binding response OmpR family regulator